MEENEPEQLEFVAEMLPNHRGLQNGKACCLSFDGTGDCLAVGYVDGRIFIFDLPTRTTKSITAAHNLEVYSISWSSCNTRLVSSGEDDRVYFWEVATMQRLGGIKYNSLVQEAMYSPGNRNQVLVNATTKIHLESEVPNHSLENTWTRYFGGRYITALAYSKDGSTVLAALNTRKIYIYAVVEDRLEIRKSTRVDIHIMNFIAPPDSEYVFVVGHIGAIRAYDLQFLMREDGENNEPIVIPQDYTEMNLNEKRSDGPLSFVSMDTAGKMFCGAERITNTIVFWNLLTRTKIGTVRRTIDMGMLDMKWSPSRTQIVMICRGEIFVLSSWEAYEEHLRSEGNSDSDGGDNPENDRPDEPRIDVVDDDDGASNASPTDGFAREILDIPAEDVVPEDEADPVNGPVPANDSCEQIRSNNRVLIFPSRSVLRF